VKAIKYQFKTLWRMFFTSVVVLLSVLVVLFSGCSGRGGSSASLYNISGTVSGDIGQGVTITLSGDGSGTTTTDAGGNYSFTGIANGSYIVTPTLAGYIFTSTSRAIRVSGANATAVDFTSTKSADSLYSISGIVTNSDNNGEALHNVTMTLSGANSGTVTTATNGSYTFSGLANGGYTLIPSLSGYVFKPSSSSQTIDGKNITGLNFTAAVNPTPTYTISGTVTSSSGAGMQGITVSLSGAGIESMTTDAGGRYTFSGLANGNYILAPSESSGDTFDPENISKTINGADITGVNFIDTTTAYSISGKVSGAVSAGVTMTLSGTASGSVSIISESVISDSNGNYSFQNLENGSYNITPTLEGYTFTPPTLVVGVSDRDITSINFTSSPL
jgi:hypothetical protein